MTARSLLAAAAFGAALFMPAVAAAQTIAYATQEGYSNLRAGPSTRYEVIARVYPGSQVDVLGCLATRDWCEVVVEDISGWMFARRLEFAYSGRRVLVPDYYSYFDVPFVTFEFGDYQRRHHRNRHGHRDHGRDHGKEYTGHPGGGGPGPETIDPGYDGDPADGYAGGSGPGPDTIPPADDGGNKQYFGHPGGGAPGPETIDPGSEGVPLEGGRPCRPGRPGCQR